MKRVKKNMTEKIDVKQAPGELSHKEHEDLVEDLNIMEPVDECVIEGDIFLDENIISITKLF